MNIFISTDFLYTPDAWMFHIQKPTSRLKPYTKNTLGNFQQRS